MAFADPGSRRHPALAFAVVAAHAAVVWLVATQSPAVAPLITEAMTVFEVPTPAPPAEPDKKPAAKAPRPEGEASAANRKATPTEVVAPEPVVRIETPPPPIVAAPTSGAGIQADAGATPVEGPGTGAGGTGTGLGSGGQGTGTGGGGAAAIWVKGKIGDRDYPRSAAKAKAGGAVVAFFDVQVNGRATNCRISESSGNADLDATTCRLIEKRFRYRPAVDAAGRPRVSEEGWRQTWWLEER